MLHSISKKIGIISSIVTLTIFGNAHAGSSSGAVSMLMVHSPEIVIFRAGTHLNKPACSTAGEDWAISLNSHSGRAIYAMLLTAKSQNKNVTVIGQGICSAWGDREAPLYILLN